MLVVTKTSTKKKNSLEIKLEEEISRCNVCWVAV